MVMRDKILGGIIGFCVGDALGVPVEFMNRESLAQDPVTDMRGYGTYNQPPGTWSDDTSMTLCLMDSLTGGLDYHNIMQKFMLWIDKGEYTPHGEVFDIGIATRKALQRFAGGTEPLVCGGTLEFDNGNGSLMRILPLVFYLCMADKCKTDDDFFECVHNVSSLTHAHKRSHIACGIYLSVARNILLGDRITKNGISKAKEYYSEKPDYTDELNLFQRIFNDDFINLPQEKIKSSGYVVDTLEAALWCLMNTADYESCVLKAVNLGEDTDTVAAIAGGLAGMLYGVESIPEKWLNQIVRLEYIKKLCADFYSSINNIQKMQFALDDLNIIQKYFHDLILDRNKYNQPFLENENKKLPTITNGIREKEKWYPVPGMYGGFKYYLTEKKEKPMLISESWCRVVGGSGQRHEITTDGCVCVEEGFV